MHPDGAVPRDQRARGARGHQEDRRERRATTGSTRRARSSTTRAPTRPRSTRCSRASSSQRVQEWLDLADERLEGKPFQMYMAPGNDDWFVIDDMIDNAKLVHPCDKRVVEIDHHEMITSSASNPTPWQTAARDERGRPREAPARAVRQGQEPGHGDLQLPRAAVRLLARPVPQARREPHHGRRREDPRRQPRAPSAVIEEYQPLLGLHGHIHESRGAQKAGRTLLINPGSEYSEGILKGVIIMLDKKKIKDYVFTSG